MKHVKLFEQWDNPQSDNYRKRTTVAEFFNWYTGPDWADDWQTTNTMAIEYPDGHSDHAQDDGENGMTHLMDLKAAENEKIMVACEDGGNAWDCSFTLASNGRTYEVQAVEAF